MAKPTYSNVHVDIPLTQFSIAYKPGTYIATEVFPQVRVQYPTGKYFIYTKADWLRREVAVRAPGARAARGDYGLSVSNYTCVERAIAKQVADEVVDNADSPIKPIQDATMWVTEQVLAELENNVADLVFGTGWASSATPSVVWSNDTSNPIGDVETGMNQIVSTIGKEATVGVIGRSPWKNLKQHPDIVDRIKGAAGPSNPAIVGLNAIAALFGLGKFVVGVAIEETAAEGATSSQAYYWGSHMALLYVPSGPSLATPAAGYVFTHKDREISRFREDQERADVVECRMNWTSLQTATDAGYLLKSVI